MKSFLGKVGDSIASFSFYQQLVSFSLLQTVKFYLGFLLVASVLHSIPFLVSTLPTTVRQTETALAELQAKYPDNLQFTWDGTKLAASESPLEVPYPLSWNQKSEFKKSTELLAYIDTTTNTVPPNGDQILTTDKALLTVGAKELYIPSPEKTQEKVQLASFLKEPFTVTKTSLQTAISHWQSNKAAILTGISLGTPLFLFVFLLIQRTSMVLIEGSLFYLFRRILGSNWYYSTAIQYGLHFFIPAEIIDFVARLLYPKSDFSFFSLTVWVYFLTTTFYPSFRRWQSVKRD